MLKVKFAHPLMLGQTEFADFLKVRFIKPEIFTNTEKRKSLSTSYHKVDKRLPVQMEETASSQLFMRYTASFETGMNAAAITQLVLNSFLSLALNAFLQLLESFQLVSFALIMSFDIPANVQVIRSCFSCS